MDRKTIESVVNRWMTDEKIRDAISESRRKSANNSAKISLTTFQQALLQLHHEDHELEVVCNSGRIHTGQIVETLSDGVVLKPKNTQGAIAITGTCIRSAKTNPSRQSKSHHTNAVLDNSLNNFKCRSLNAFLASNTLQHVYLRLDWIGGGASQDYEVLDIAADYIVAKSLIHHLNDSVIIRLATIEALHFRSA